MFAVKFLANTAVVCIVILYFEHTEYFHISHFTYHLGYYYSWSKLKAVNNVLTSYIKLCYVYVKFKRTNQSCSFSKISQRTCDRNGKQFFQWKSFDKARNVLIENKNRDIGSEKYILLAFTKYLRFPEVEKNSKVVNV